MSRGAQLGEWGVLLCFLGAGGVESCAGAVTGMGALPCCPPCFAEELRTQYQRCDRSITVWWTLPQECGFSRGWGGEGRVDKVIFRIFVFVSLAYLQPPSIPRYYFFRKSLLFEGGPVRCQWPAGGAWSLRVLVLNLCGLSCTFPELLGDEKPPLTS